VSQFNRKYKFTPELTDELRRAYCGNKHQLTAALDRLVMRTGWPRHAHKQEAIRLGITSGERRAWTPAEIAYIEENLGVISVKGMARHLGRTSQALTAKAEKLHLSRRVREGYNIADLQQVFGVSAEKVRRWMERGLFGPQKDWGGRRVSEDAVMTFIRQHHAEYDLRRVDQAWYKAMAFAGAVWRTEGKLHGDGFGFQDQNASGDSRRG
jgi:hypothetical protein